jgi:hypothetical protein
MDLCRNDDHALSSLAVVVPESFWSDDAGSVEFERIVDRVTGDSNYCGTLTWDREGSYGSLRIGHRVQQNPNRSSTHSMHSNATTFWLEAEVSPLWIWGSTGAEDEKEESGEEHARLVELQRHLEASVTALWDHQTTLWDHRVRMRATRDRLSSLLMLDHHRGGGAWEE